ncbi:phosphate propanoyltransferase [Sinanaerobacter sp. ZZT-01]|uniref:phosphate propanoyltransferase n=1 Tax=Sinanaerobacter sp. ZZT-01 TaxID=3111540 RepID=UPI002D79B5F0|nr:phosphate propanoyltransferase [Sinanaerobacter sp. ZZT-01]WRR92629.1 phosphate propanoyltransferase [Sinanaerobacter sp. ZZT-01]
MSTLNITNEEELIKIITKLVIEALSNKNLVIPIGVSNRHVHLCRSDMDLLFGTDSQLTKMKALKQPGQFAAEEVVTLMGPKGQIEKVRVLGPLREQTQIEISLSDTYVLGVKAPIRESGKLEGTPGIEMIGPKGGIIKSQGTIVASRHIHMPPNIALKLGLKDGELVDVELGKERGAVLKNVLLRISDKDALEMHIDMDEANAVNVKNNESVRIIK